MVPASAQFLNDNFFVLHCHCFVLNKLLCLVRESKAYICLPALVCVYAHITYLSSICTYTDSDGKSCMYVIKLSMKGKIKRVTIWVTVTVNYLNHKSILKYVSWKVLSVEVYVLLCGCVCMSAREYIHICKLCV